METADTSLDSRWDPAGQARLARETPLLLHSLREFSTIIEALLTAVEPERVIEFGGETGDSAITFLSAGAKQVVCVDPNPSPRLTERASDEERLTVLTERSLDCLPSLPPSSFWVIDGDHNYATVRAELDAILERADTEHTPLILLHDVMWPCARRDLYYDPDALDPATVHPHRWDVGPTILSDDLETNGLIGRGQYAFATRVGGERNGVRTAVEDVLAVRPELEFLIVPAIFGLGIVFDRSAPWAPKIKDQLKPWDRSPFLTRLEVNRLALYFHVLKVQHELERRTEQFERHARALDAEIARLRSDRAAQRVPSQPLDTPTNGGRNVR